MDPARPYTVNLQREDDSGVEEVLCAASHPKIARAAYRAAVDLYPGRIITLQNRALVMARSDR